MLRTYFTTVLAIIASVLLSGCAAPRGIHPVGNNHLVLVRSEAVSYPGKFKLRQKIVEEVVQHCAMSGKLPSIVGALEMPAQNIIVNFRWARIEFVCVSPGSRDRPGTPAAPPKTKNIA